MKWAFQVKDKMKVAGLLVAIIAIIALGHISGQQNYSDLDHSISSIYQDRLLPATYLFQLSDHLYQKRLLQEEYKTAPNTAYTRKNREHDKAIATLIRDYEATYLTPEEKQQWKTFKTNLHHYLLATGSTAANENTEHLFANTIGCLNELNKIQAGEGQHLRKNSRAIIDGTLIASYLEVSLLIVLGIMTVILLSATDNRVFRQVQNHPMN